MSDFIKPLTSSLVELDISPQKNISKTELIAVNIVHLQF